MVSDLLSDVSLFRVLHQIDVTLAETCRKAGCPFCGGLLHYAPYVRKPRGGPDAIPEEYQKRLSLCCSNSQCRKRVLPQSCLFLGRKVYWKAVIIVAISLHQRRLRGYSINQLHKIFSISRKTIVRWLHYFRRTFPISQKWQQQRGQVSPTISDCGLPGNLLDHFLCHSSNSFSGLVACLKFLGLEHGY